MCSHRRSLGQIVSLEETPNYGSPSYPGASGIAFLNCGITIIVATLNTRYPATRGDDPDGLVDLDFHARATYPTVACASIQLIPNSISAKNRASPGRLIVMSRSREGRSCGVFESEEDEEGG